MAFFAIIKDRIEQDNFRYGSLAAAVLSADTTADFGLASIDQGMYVYLYNADTDVSETMQVGTLVSGTTYNVTRDVNNQHATDPIWPMGQYLLFMNMPGTSKVSNLLEMIDVSTSLRFSTQLSGGFSTCAFKITGTLSKSYERINTLLGAHVVIKDSLNKTVWEGYISNTNMGADMLSVDVSATGYYAKANNQFFDMVYWYPEATTNLVKNPSFETSFATGGDGWSNYTGLPGSRITTDAKFGSACLKIAQALSGTADYVVRLQLTGMTSGATYTWSFYAKSAGILQIPYVQATNSDNSVRLMSDTQLIGLSTTEWKRYTFQFTNTVGNTTVNLYFAVPEREPGKTASYFMVDGVQVEAKGYATDYCDGTLPNCSWSGTAHNSTSSRVAVPIYQRDVLGDVIDFIPEWRDFKTFVQDGDYDIGNCNFLDKKSKAAIEYAIAFGRNVGGKAKETHFAIWEDRIAYLVTEPDLNTVIPEWFLYVMNQKQAASANAGLDLTAVFNKVYSVYADIQDGPSKTPGSSDTASQERYGIIEGMLQNGDYPFTETQSTFMEQAALERFKYPRMVMSFSVSGNAKHTPGFYDAVYNIRAGDTILLADAVFLAPGVGSYAGGEKAYRTVCFILSTDYDAVTDTLTFAVGSGDVSFELLMGRLGISGGLA